VVRAAVNLIPEEPIARMVELARHAEALGYERVWIYDEGLATRDVYVTMAAVVAATERLTVGPGITNPYTRHPAATAAAVASVDELSGGRAFLGIGAGGSLTLDPIGLERSRPLASVREAITAARALFRGDAVDIEGETLRLRGARLAYARPSTEIWLAGRGPRMLALGGELCDGVMLDFIHKPSLGATIERIRAGGRGRAAPARVSYSTMVITDDAAMEATRPHLTYRLVDSPPAIREAIGLGDDDTERIRSALADGLAAAAEHVRDEWVLPFVIAGRVDECATELGDIVERHGIDEFLLPVLDDAGAAGLMATVARVLSL